MLKTLDVEQLRPLYLDEPHALRELFLETLGVTAELIGRLTESGRCGDEAMHLAHELKGVCRTTGAEELAFLAGEIESLAAEEDWEEVEVRQEMLARAHRRFAAAIKAVAALA